MKTLIKHNKLIRVGDNVKVISGSCKGFEGTVIKRTDEYVFIKGCNLRLKTKRIIQNNTSKKEHLNNESPIHISNVIHFDSVTQKRVFFEKKKNEKNMYERCMIVEGEKK